MDAMASHDRWRLARAAELSAPDSWLGLVGLFWLEPGNNTVGSDPASTVCLPSGPQRLGSLDWRDDRVTWRPVAGAERPLASDVAGSPTAVDHENLSFFIVDRDGRLAVRVRDRAWAAKRPFVAPECYAYDPAWRIAAAWQPLDPPLTIDVPNVSGDLKTVRVAHQATFTVADAQVTLLPVSADDSGVFFVFRDRTSGRETYGAGRFLKVPAAVDGRITLDFNFAYNPPCAFTAFATCPLPPPENWLPFAVPAGERKWKAEN
jgi:uncharacterized protein (DUF1684 family)